ncbi:MAG: hypothetical protein Kow0029_20250 [Candidatus Rifleibacteriota bacterium]
MKKHLLLTIFFLVMPIILLAVKFCPHCGYRMQSDRVECPKCLRLIDWPVYPPRNEKATIIVREGKDAFIRHPRSQNRAYRSNRNAGGDLTGQIGSWGFLTGLRYLVSFNIEKSFADAKIDMNHFEFTSAKLRLYVADKKIDQQIPIRVYPLARPFQEGIDRFHIRSKIPTGCTWELSAPMLPWRIPGGDYYKDISCPGILGKNGQRECVIDVSAIYKYRFAQFKETGIWNDPGMIIMRDPEKACECTFLSIYSLENKTKSGIVVSPQLFIE